MARVILNYTLDVELDTKDIWPDGDVPEDVTAEDVENVIEACGGWYDVIADWNLDHNGWGSVTVIADKKQDQEK